MRQLGWRHHYVARRTIGLTAVALGLLAGCQQYERQPLELDAHRASMNERTVEVGRIEQFVERLRHLGAETPAVFSFGDGLAPAEGEVLALFYNAELRQARLEAGVAAANFEQAGLWDDPEFGFDAAEVLSPSGSPFEFGLTLSLTIPISGRLEVEKARAGSMYEAALRRLVHAEWDTRAAVRRAWAAWTVAEERLELSRSVIDQVERIDAITDRLVAAGELRRIDGRLLQVELASRRAAAAEAERQATRTRIHILGLMGLPPNADVELTPAFPRLEATANDDPVGQMITHNTELAIRRASYQVAEESLRLEVRKQYPDITIGSGYGSEDDDDRLLLGFSIPIPVLNANRAGIAEARAERDVSRAAAEAAFERLCRELALAEADHSSATDQRERYESEIVPMLDIEVAEIEQIAELGEVDTLLLLAAVQAQFEAKSRLLELRQAELNAAVTIAQLLGPSNVNDPALISDNNTNVAAAEGPSPAAGGER